MSEYRTKNRKIQSISDGSIKVNEMNLLVAVDEKGERYVGFDGIIPDMKDHPNVKKYTDKVKATVFNVEMTKGDVVKMMTSKSFIDTLDAWLWARREGVTDDEENEIAEKFLSILSFFAKAEARTEEGQKMIQKTLKDAQHDYLNRVLPPMSNAIN